MKQSIIIDLKKDDKIERFREKYSDKLINPHITLVYPFEVDNQDKLKKHIQNVIKNFNSFEVVLKGIGKSKLGYYLYLLVGDGEEKIISLYRKLNRGILAGFENPKMPKYIPHLSLAFFDNEESRNNAFEEAVKENFILKFKVEEITLLTIKSDSEKIFEKFKLK